jgi:hypothetical protein
MMAARTTTAPGRLGRIRRALTVALPVAGLTLTMTACSEDLGPESTREIAIDDATAVELATSGDLTISQGDTPALTVHAPEGLHERLVHEVREGVLVLDSRGRFGFSSWGDVRYELVLPEVSAVTVTGSGDVEADGVAGDEVSIWIRGSGDVTVGDVDADVVRAGIEGSGAITLSGRADAAQVSIAGSGSLLGERLRVDEADVSIDGSGDVDIDVVDRLRVAIGGSGSVVHHGDPEVVSEIDGAGSVSRS